MSKVVDLEKFVYCELKQMLISDMATEFGITEEQVINYRTAMGMPQRIEKSGVVDLLTYKKLRDAGKDFEFIARYFGVSLDKITDLQSKLDVIANPAGFDRQIQKSTAEIIRTVGLKGQVTGKLSKRGRHSVVDDDKLIKMVNEGCGNQEIADEFGITAAAISNHKRRLGLSRTHIYHNVTDDEIEKICEYKLSGYSDAKISDMMGIPAYIIGNVRRKNGLCMRG